MTLRTNNFFTYAGLVFGPASDHNFRLVSGLTLDNIIAFALSTLVTHIAFVVID